MVKWFYIMRLALTGLILKLKNQNKTVAVAESASGGYLSYLLSSAPGSSAVFKGGVIVYSLETKNKFLKLPIKLLKQTQGVSKKVSILLALAVRKKLDSSLGIAIVGFAGPKAKKGIKPGTMFITLTSKTKIWSKKLIIKGDRNKARIQASYAAIQLLNKYINNKNA